MFSVDVKGLDALRKIDGKGAREAIKNAARGIGAAAVSQASLLAPVDTGLLRSSINYGLETGNVDADAIVVGSKVKYAPFQELGTKRGIKPKKFLWGAIFPEFRQTVYNHIINKFVGAYWESVGK